MAIICWVINEKGGQGSPFIYGRDKLSGQYNKDGYAHFINDKCSSRMRGNLMETKAGLIRAVKNILSAVRSWPKLFIPIVVAYILFMVIPLGIIILFLRVTAYACCLIVSVLNLVLDTFLIFLTRIANELFGFKA